jgi:hypothetical protein
MVAQAAWNWWKFEDAGKKLAHTLETRRSWVLCPPCASSYLDGAFVMERKVRRSKNTIALCKPSNKFISFPALVAWSSITTPSCNLSWQLWQIFKGCALSYQAAIFYSSLLQSSKESESITRCELCFKNLDQKTHKTIAVLKLPKDKFCSKGAERKCSKLVGLTEQKTRRKLLLHNTRNCKCLKRITNVHYLLLAILNYKIPPKVQPISHENL